ncbi:MAG: LysM peptidoglycan-binding domain-containing protein [Acidobacteria bacterium]|nr:MAG: LysM peptidoglycan-binding domain-containing protein [Acidobacteriota bacterium]
MALMLRRWCLLSFLVVFSGFTVIAANQAAAPAPGSEFSKLFPSAGFEERVEFWKMIFTRYGRDEVVVHDRKDLRLIYKVVSSPYDGTDRASIRRRQAQMKQTVDGLARTFDDLIALGPDSDQLEFRHHELLAVLKLANHQPTEAALRRLKGNVHLQRGIKEKFREGLVRSGRYLPHLEQIFTEKGLPPELVLLPHVESSFDYSAYSSKGAAGIWQITRGTGRKLLKIGRTVDERLHPIRAGEAAAQLLLDNYQALGTWPLAITAYNQGKYGMLRAQAVHGSDLKNIVDNYQSKIFGYAGENFYAEFLAAVEITRDHEKFFPSLQIDMPLSFATVTVPTSTSIKALANRYKVSTEALRAYNPHLTSRVWRRASAVPAGTAVHLPSGQRLTTLAENTAPERTTSKPAASNYTRYKVRRGDTLSKIARRFQVGIDQLKELNRINSTRIYLGQLLLIP